MTQPWPGEDEEGGSLYSGLTSPTVKVSGRLDESVPETAPFTFDEPKTRIYRGPGQAEQDAALPAGDFMRDPPAGCLLVVGGPGRGAIRNLGLGRNSVGRDAGERVSLNFGDDQISRTGHLEIICDPRTCKFYAQGTPQARNLAYIGGEPLLTPVLLKAGDLLSLGNTTLKFFPFVSQDWNWSHDVGST